MNKKVFLIFLILLIVIVVFFVSNKRTFPLVSPALKQSQVAQSTPMPVAPSYSPPGQVQYDSSTDLKKELDSVNPQVLDSDFK